MHVRKRLSTLAGGCGLLLLSAVAGRGPDAAPPVISEFSLPTAASQPTTEIHGPDGNLWFTEMAGNKIGMITPAGQISEFTVPTPASQPFVITDGPDGNLWFTEQTGNQIGRITTAGQIREFLIPTLNSAPQSIVVGPDGNLWFTERDGNNIGRITPAGSITEFAIATATSQPTRIIAGNDGNLWFTELTGNKIGRITPAGVIAEFTIPTAQSQPQQIITGPDGNLWFVEQTGNNIARITPAGQITEFPLQTANSQPNRIVSGLDGNLWFTESSHNRIGKITPAGAISEFPLPNAGSGPNRIARGRDGNLWFNENAGNRIGRITYAGAITEFPLASPAESIDQLATSFDGNLWYTATNANVIGRIVVDGFNAPTLAAAVLPGSRSVQAGSTATAFALIFNAGATTATSCQINDHLVTQPENFLYQTTDPATNNLTGTPNTPVDIPAGKFQTFVFAMTATGPFVPEDLRLNFVCLNVGSVPFILGVNTFLLSASAAPVPDIVSLAATISNDGIVHVPGSAGVGFFAVATSNAGALGTLVFSADTGGAVLPLVLTVCQTNPATGACQSPPKPSVQVNIDPGATPTFAVFVAATGSVPFDPANSRVYARFKDLGGATRGDTSVAVTTTQ